MLHGWIKFPRDIYKNPLWYKLSDEGIVVLVTVLLKARYKNTLWQIDNKNTVELKPGELFITIRTLAKECGVSVSQVRKQLQIMRKYNFLSTDTSKLGTIVRINNWEKYSSGV